MTTRPVTEITVRKIKLDRDGYERGTGAYFGIGAPVWNMRDANDKLGIHHNFHASGIQNARAYARSYMDFHHKSDVRFVR